MAVLSTNKASSVPLMKILRRTGDMPLPCGSSVIGLCLVWRSQCWELFVCKSYAGCGFRRQINCHVAVRNASHCLDFVQFVVAA